ncbi:MAG TPA: hypothetical protein VGR82_17600 [Methylomirabilota bacterium]|jgi:hypothetical protein|nr:hypothetical protein [Methylomirabilota bacterium]
MPRVEAYGQQRVGTDPISGQKKDAALTPDAAGGQFGETLARLGSAGLNEVRKRQMAERQRANELTELTAERQFNDLDTLYLHDAQRGALNKGGREPMDLREQYTTEWDTSADEILKAAKNPEQQLALTRLRDRRRASFTDQYDSHASSQFAQYEVGEVNATLESSVQAASHAVNLPGDQRVAAIAEQLAMQRRTIERYAERLKLGPEGGTALMQKLASATHVGVIEQLIAKQDDLAAEEYFTEVRDDIAAPQRADLAVKLENGSRDARAFAAADAIWAKSAPDVGDDISPIQLDKMEAAARAKFQKDPKAMRAAVQYLRDRKQGVDDARRERKNATDSTLWSAVASNKSLSAVRLMPEFRLAPGEEQLKVIDYYRREAEHKESLAASRESRAYTQAQRAERELEERGYDTYLELKADPAKLRAMTDGEILKMLPDVGQANVNRILNEREQLLKSKTADALDGFRTNQQIAEGALRKVGINTSDSEAARKSGDRARADRFLSVLDTRVAALQGQTGKKVTNEEIERLADALLIEVHVGGDPQRVFDVAPRDLPDWARHRLAAAEIPATDRRQIDDALRRAGRPVNDVERLKLYLQKLAAGSAR